jgi:hypothetical protein
MSLTKVTFAMIDGAVANILDFGASPTASTATNTAAITAALATGRSVYIPQGTYNVAPVTTPVSGTEPNRTSAWVLTDNQVVFGDGPNTVLVWDNATVQCFFKVADAVDVALKNIRFDGGYSSIVVYPDADGSVDGVVVENCYFDNMLIDVIGGNQLAVNSDSKFAKNITVKGCKTSGPAVHSILFTNCYNAQAIGNTFNNVTGGYCVDASQGSRNVIISDNVADTCDYFCKIESSDAGAVNPTQWASREVIIANNTAINVNLTGIFVNTAADHIVIEGNVMVGFSTHGILLDQVSGFTYNGSVSVSNNVLSAAPASTNAFGILDSLSNGTLPHVFTGNVIDEVLLGIQISRKNAVITGGSISADSSCIVLNVPSILDGVCISGVKMTGGGGVNINGTGQPVKRITVTGCDITFASSAIFSQASISQSIFNDNTINSAAPTVGGIVLETPVNCSVQNNTINLNTSTLNSISTATSATDCIFVGNISNRAFNINAPSVNTINAGNITTAAYVA